MSARAILLILTLGLVPLPAHALLIEKCESVFPSPLNERLSGPVKTYSVEHAGFTRGLFGRKETPRKRGYTARYDSNGNMVEETHFKKDGRIGSKNVYTYDANGNLLTQQTYPVFEWSIAKSTFEYNDHEQTVTKNNLTDSGELITRYVYRFDRQGHITEESIYNDGGRRTRHTLFIFDAEGKLITRDEVGFWHAEHVTCTYDSQNRLTLSTFRRTVDSELKSANEQRYEYADNRVTQESCLGKEHLICHKSHVLQYGPQGLQEDTSYNHDGSLLYRSLYDERGMLLRLEKHHSLFNTDPEGWVYRYEYDRFGNWTKRVDLCGKVDDEESAMRPCGTTYCKITYHEDTPEVGTRGDTGSQTNVLRGTDTFTYPKRLPYLSDF